MSNRIDLKKIQAIRMRLAKEDNLENCGDRTIDTPIISPPEAIPSEAKREIELQVRTKILGEDEKKVIIEQTGLKTEQSTRPSKEEWDPLAFLDFKVGLVGFKCPKENGAPVPFRKCIYECPRIHERRCYPLPLLLALMSRRWPSSVNRFSTTEFLNPPKPMWLKRHYPYWVDPLDMIWMTFGSAWHYAVEKQKYLLKDLGLADHYSIENEGKSFRKEFTLPSGLVILTGKPDLLIRPPEAPVNILDDFKTMKYYWTLKYLLERKNWDDGTYHWQVNIYRKYCFPEAEEMNLIVLVKDYNNKVKDAGVRPVEEIPVPFIRDSMIDEFVKSRLDYCHQCELDPSVIRECLDEEKWFTKKPPIVPLRCRDYCPVNYRCEWYMREIMDQSEADDYFAKLKEEDQKNGFPHYEEGRISTDQDDSTSRV